MDDLTRLELALVLTRPGASRRLVGQAKGVEGSVTPDLLNTLDEDQRCCLRLQAEDLDQRGVGVLIRGLAGYPATLNEIRSAPSVLFHLGPINILDRPGIGICGSRNATSDGLRAASICGELAAGQGIVAVSGYARGVDTATHVASLKHGGETIIVLPEGIENFRVKKNGIRDVWDQSRALVISQFAPTQTWSTGAAMARNTVIIGLSKALVVVEAGETGGTLAAGRQALAMHRRVLVPELPPAPLGNQILISEGAISVRDRSELAVFLSDLCQVAEESELSLDSQLQHALPFD